ncbi:MAG: right-handed parallel beta-helix repeat-containing protein [Sphingobium sp.]|nr:right-handed parallel beta-helix repeat-containing protein [Sphingobium sp.]MBP8671473.1 right-handed parallel beta-helix repeat-containing protein [Sphingobium sp.]MBP9158549.1 right-handed parallel beta-helix repeat-containing protein [Sphingobium sp.]MCC6940806.1 right-handed parallel beta-helix repeat-containing protein [Novosphingobium sp.]
MRTLLSLLLIPLLTGAASQPNPFTIMETGRTTRTLAEAVAAIGDRRGTIIIAPGTYRQCAVQEAGTITYRAQRPGSVVFDGVTCEGKAALVLRGRSASVEAIIFQNMRVADGNGAGIRLERGNLTVSASLFRTSEEGILTHDDPQSTIRIDHSIFGRLGRCDRDLDCAHSIYVGHYGHLIVTATRFEAGMGGHYLKSRAARVTITGNVFDDRAGRLTNYMIDLSNGASGLIANNNMVQGRDKDNYSAFITIAPEGREWDSNGLQIRDNQASFGGNFGRNSTFVANWTTDRPQIVGNRLTTGIKVTDRR